MLVPPPVPEGSGVTRAAGLGALAALFLAALALRPQLVGIGPLLPRIEEDLSVSHAVAGLLLSLIHI